jgi:hypothetical protein
MSLPQFRGRLPTPRYFFSPSRVQAGPESLMSSRGPTNSLKSRLSRNANTLRDREINLHNLCEKNLLQRWLSGSRVGTRQFYLRPRAREGICLPQSRTKMTTRESDVVVRAEQPFLFEVFGSGSFFCGSRLSNRFTPPPGSAYENNFHGRSEIQCVLADEASPCPPHDGTAQSTTLETVPDLWRVRNRQKVRFPGRKLRKTCSPESCAAGALNHFRWERAGSAPRAVPRRAWVSIAQQGTDPLGFPGGRLNQSFRPLVRMGSALRCVAKDDTSAAFLPAMSGSIGTPV